MTRRRMGNSEGKNKVDITTSVVLHHIHHVNFSGQCNYVSSLSVKLKRYSNPKIAMGGFKLFN